VPHDCGGICLFFRTLESQYNLRTQPFFPSRKWEMILNNKPV
jgi:hypothetical protein